MSWINENNALHKTYTFADFESAMHFMQLAAKSISIQNHHPEWSNVYNKVAIKLTTHDAGNTITEKDEILALALDKIFNKIQ
jgi:4a-hydroxytetrahydrobiopterin dehydratase